MKAFTKKEIEKLNWELAKKRAEFEKINFSSLDEKLNWIRNFFAKYIYDLERSYMTENELKRMVFLPNEVSVLFYMYFPEHGLNIELSFRKVVKELEELQRNSPI